MIGQRRPVDVAALLARLPLDGLDVRVDGPASLQADEDLPAAALLNLLDNALRLHDDGLGVGDERRQALPAALHARSYADATGLGLMLADLVARSQPVSATSYVEVRTTTRRRPRMLRDTTRQSRHFVRTLRRPLR